MAHIALKFLIPIIIIHHRLKLIDAKYVEPPRTISTPGVSFKLENIIAAEYNFEHGVSCHEFPYSLNIKGSAIFYYRSAGGGDPYVAWICPPYSGFIKYDGADSHVPDSGKDCPKIRPPYLEEECYFCPCYGSFERSDYNVQSKITLTEQQSDLGNNKVVTGLRFLLHDKIVYPQIQEAKLLPNGRVDNDKTWKNLVYHTVVSDELDDYGDYKYEPDTNLPGFDYLFSTIYLDEISLPEDYVVTGVKLEKIGGEWDHQYLQMLVKGTRFDEHYRLLEGTDKWFDYSNGSSKHTSYDFDRREINLANCEPSDLASGNTDIDGTNYYVRLRPSKNYTFDQRSPAIPYFSGDSMEVADGLPLQGLGLSYKGSGGFGGYITVKVFPHESFAIKPKIVSTIKLRTTMAPEVTSSVRTDISTRLVPTLQSIPKRLRNEPANVSCSGKFLGSPKEESVDLSGEFLIPIDQSGNFGATFHCQFSLIGALLLYIFLF